GRRHCLDDRLDVGQRLGEQPALHLQSTVAGLAADERRDFSCQPLEGGAAVAQDLAEEEIEALNRRRALVEGVDLGVADVLLERIVLKEARAAEGLERLRPE